MPVCSCCSMWCGFVGVVIVVWCGWLAFDFVVLAVASWFNVVVLVFRFAFLVEFCVCCITAWFTFGWWVCFVACCLVCYVGRCLLLWGVLVRFYLALAGFGGCYRRGVLWLLVLIWVDYDSGLGSFFCLRELCLV